MEAWKDLPAAPELYEVSNYGHVRNKFTGHILRYYRDKIYGYCHVTIYTEGGKHKSISVHRQVALAFVERTNKAADAVHHINGSKVDNRPANLMWVTPKEHGRLEAERRAKYGIKTKAHENHVKREAKFDYDF